LNNVILLVEDSSSDEKLTLVAFRRSGVPHEMVVARDGADALDYLERRGKYADRDPGARPALILLDLKLPRVGGLEVLRRVREDPRTRMIPIVILTASKEEADVARAYSLGANGYVHKPVDFGEFAEGAKTLAQFWLRWNEQPPAGRGSDGVAPPA